MLAQLCKAKPWTISCKASSSRDPPTSGRQQPCRLPASSNALQSTAPEGWREDNHCQLRDCTFCDYRVCCLVSPIYSPENRSDNILEPANSCLQVTENPAYGLSSENWLETSSDGGEHLSPQLTVCQQMDTTTDKDKNISPEERVVNNWSSSGPTSEDSVQESDETTSEITMNYINIPPRCLESIPECRNEGGLKQINITPDCNLIDTGSKNRDTKLNGLSWSVLRHRQINGGALEDCDTKCDDLAIDNSKTCDKLCDNKIEAHNRERKDIKLVNRQKCNLKDKSFPLSLIKPHIRINEKRQPDFLSDRPLQRSKNEPSRLKSLPLSVKDNYFSSKPRGPCAVTKDTRNSKPPHDVLGRSRLSEITTVKTEESIQEWLMRISEWVDNNSWIKDSCDEDDSAENTSEEELNMKNEKKKVNHDTNSKYPQKDIHSVFNTQDIQFLDEENTHTSEKDSRHQSTYDQLRKDVKCDTFQYQDSLQEASTNVNDVLREACKDCPANIPMVVMQCSRLHSHITSKPPFQQTSLPMGTLVTALYQESDWLYVQTPHGVEGFVTSANCVPIGTVNGSSQSTKRPWEPCEFPIQISIKNPCDFGRQQGSFVPAKLPTSSGKRAGPFVNMVKMKTNFYNERYFHNTFKPRDSIKTAKTVTDILRSSPETKITNQ